MVGTEHPLTQGQDAFVGLLGTHVGAHVVEQEAEVVQHRHQVRMLGRYALLEDRDRSLVGVLRLGVAPHAVPGEPLCGEPLRLRSVVVGASEERGAEREHAGGFLEATLVVAEDVEHARPCIGDEHVVPSLRRRLRGIAKHRLGAFVVSRDGSQTAHPIADSCEQRRVTELLGVCDQ